MVSTYQQLINFYQMYCVSQCTFIDLVGFCLHRVLKKAFTITTLPSFYMYFNNQIHNYAYLLHVSCISRIQFKYICYNKIYYTIHIINMFWPYWQNVMSPQWTYYIMIVLTNDFSSCSEQLFHAGYTNNKP